jgi:hypothetical protein
MTESCCLMGRRRETTQRHVCGPYGVRQLRKTTPASVLEGLLASKIMSQNKALLLCK